MRDLENLLRILIWKWLNAAIPPSRPSSVSVTLVEERKVEMLIYQVALPASTDPDVVSWEMETTVNGASPSVSAVTDKQEVGFNQGDSVSLRVREVDDADNKSEWSEAMAFTASDTLPPATPGAPGVTLVREE